MGNPLDDLMRIAETRVQDQPPEAFADVEDVYPETVEIGDDETVLSAEQAADVQAAADAYMALLSDIGAARPRAPQLSEDTQLSGAEWIAQGVREQLATSNVTDVRVKVLADSVTARVTIPQGDARDDWRPFLAARLSDRGNLGAFAAADDATDPRNIFLTRRDIQGPGVAWRAHGPKAANFFADRDGQRAIFDLAKVFQTRKSDGARRYPRVEKFDEDARGGTAELRLPEGMLLSKVQGAEDALRQAFNAPDLIVGSVRVHPVIHLNTHELKREFKPQNPLAAKAMWLPQTPAERYACSDEARLFLGVTETGTVIAPKLKDRSHAAVFGMTNSGKSTSMVGLARSLAAQGCEVWLVDGKGTPEFLALFLERVPGITHLSIATDGGALMYASVHKFRELYRFRAAVANELASRGVTDVQWPRVVMIFDELGEFLNGKLSEGSSKIDRKQAEACVNMLGEIGAKARAYGVHLIVAGQHVYVAALPNKIKEHLSVRVVFGKASDTHISRLYDEPDRPAAKLAREGIDPGAKGRGIVLADDGIAVQFQSFHNAGEHASAFARDANGAFRLKRWGHLFPVRDEVGGNGEWQSWGAWEGDSSYTPTGTVDDIGTVVLDRRSPVTGELEPDPAAAVWDKASKGFTPGSPPRSKAFKNVN